MSECDVSFGTFAPSELTPSASSGVSSSSSWATLDSLEEQQAALAAAPGGLDVPQAASAAGGERGLQGDALCPSVVFCMPVLLPWGAHGDAGDGWLHQETWAEGGGEQRGLAAGWLHPDPWQLPPWGALGEACASGAVPPAPGVWRGAAARGEAAAEAPAARAAPQPPAQRARPRREAAASARPHARAAGGGLGGGHGPRAGGGQRAGEPAEAAEPMPVRHTFIHFGADGAEAGAAAAAAGPAAGGAGRAASAPPLLQRRAFRLRDPRRDEAHLAGDCRPCAYYFYKEDGCRWGDECSFCHLCAEGEVKKRKKEKHKAMKMQARCARRGRPCRGER